MLLTIFYSLGILGCVLLVLQLFLVLFGLEDADPEGGGWISLKSITGFFVGFGWTGAIVTNAGIQAPWNLVIPTAAGFVVVFGLVQLMQLLHGMRKNGALDYQNAVGQVGTAYVTIPADMGEGGQVEVMVQSRLRTVACRTKDAETISPGTKVIVRGLIDRTTLEVSAKLN